MSSSTTDTSVVDKERHAIELRTMVSGTMNPKDVMDMSEYRHEVGIKNYNRLYQKAYRKRQILKKKTRNAKRIKSLDKRNKKLSKKK